MRRGRAIASALVLVGLVAPRQLPGCPRLPRVDAVGAGIAWVVDGNRSHLFSTQDGRLLRTLQPAFSVMDVHFDAKRSEFWGAAWGDSPTLWSWSESRGFQTVSVPAREIYSTFQSEDGRRLIAATLSTAASDEEVYRSFVALGFWEDNRVRFLRLAPPAAYGDSAELPILGSESLFGYLVDTSRAAPLLPSVDPSHRLLLWFVRIPGTARWLMAEQGTLRLQGSDDGARSWVQIGELPAPPPGKQFFLAGLSADPYRKNLYALIAVEGDRTGWLSVSDDAGRSWTRIVEHSTWFSPVFDPEGVWLQTSPDGEDWSIDITLLHPDGRIVRSVKLQLPQPETAPEEGPTEEGEVL